MIVSDRNDALAKAKLFESLSSKERAAVAAQMVERRLGYGDVLFHQGDMGRSLVLVVSGRLDVHLETGTDGPVGIAPIWPGEVVGEMACVDPQPRSATVVAAEPSLVLELDPPALGAIWRKSPELGARLMFGLARSLSARLRETDRRIETLMDHVSADPELAEQQRAILRPAKRAGWRPKLLDTRAARGREVDPEVIRLATGFDADTADELLALSEPMVWRDGALLCKEGAMSEDCVLLVDGRVDVIKTVARSERVMATLDAGQLVGQLGVIDGGDRSASVRAHGRVVGLRIDREAFQAVLRSRTTLGVRILTLAAVASVRQLRVATHRLADLRAARERVRRASLAGRRRPRRAPDAPGGVDSARTSGRPTAGDAASSALDGLIRNDPATLAFLDSIKVHVPEGQMSATERKARSLFR